MTLVAAATNIVYCMTKVLVIKNTRIKCLQFAVPTMQARRTAPGFVDEAEFIIYALGL